ncbi:hypothetical protein [Alkalibacterium psychrotolerans]
MHNGAYRDKLLPTFCSAASRKLPAAQIGDESELPDVLQSMLSAWALFSRIEAVSVLFFICRFI